MISNRPVLGYSSKAMTSWLTNRPIYEIKSKIFSSLSLLSYIEEGSLSL
jgi:hypothetical protein